MTSFHLLDKSCGAESYFPGQLSPVWELHPSLLQLMDRWAMARVFQLPAQENISVAVQRSSAHSQDPHWRFFLWLQVGFVLQEGDGDGEQGLSCPGDASALWGVELNVSSEPSQGIAQ